VSTVDPETARELAAAGPADAVLDTPVLAGDPPSSRARPIPHRAAQPKRSAD